VAFHFNTDQTKPSKERIGTMQPVEVLTAGLWHDSIGDIAILQATLQQLAIREIPAIAVNHASGLRTCIVGGGRIIHPQVSGGWKEVLKPFHVPGPHILNGVEVVGDVDADTLSWLNDYRYVSVRDLASLEKVRVARPDAVAVPCTAVLLEPPNQDYCRQLPGLKLLNRLHGSEYAVIDFESVSKWKCPMQSVVVNTRGWNVQDTRAEFQHRNPDALLALLAGARVCVATTLHLSILAMAAGTPFVYDTGMSGTPDKGRLYWTRAGLPDVLYDGNDPIDAAIAANGQIFAARRRERDLATKHFDQIARLLKEPSS